MVRTFSSKKTPLFDKLHRWRRLAVMRTNPQSIRCEEQNGFLLIMVPTQLVIEIIILSVFLTFHFFAKSCEIIDQKCLHVTGLIPARAGSKGIKDKNLSILGNETLLGRTLRIMKECGSEYYHVYFDKAVDWTTSLGGEAYIISSRKSIFLIGFD